MEVTATENGSVYPSLGVNEHRYNFLSSVWSESLTGGFQNGYSYESNQPKNVLKCENLSVKVPIKKKLNLKRVTDIFKNADYDRLPGSNELRLLDSVSAEVCGGEILAVLGPSGSGKTLFLSALLGHPSVKGGKISGDVLLNGHRMTDRIMEESTAFVPQKDLAVESLTIDEHMQFFASLRLWKEPKHVRTARIDELILQMNLETCRNRELRSLSSGERRRVAIVSQMIARPAVLLLDEPLTGLDAAVADTIIAALARIAQPTPRSPQGCAVVCVLHQPRPQTLRFVSKVILIADGRVAFYGTPNETEQFYHRLNPTAVTKYGAWNDILETFMVCLHKPEEADFIVRSYRDDVRYKTKISKTSTTMEKSLLDYANEVAFMERNKECEKSQNVRFGDLSVLGNQLVILDALGDRLLITTANKATAVVIGLWYTRSHARTPAGIQTASGLLFMVTSEIIYTNAYSVLYSFTPQVPVLLREKRLYGPSAYYTSKILSLLPRAVLQTVLFASVVHISGNLGGDGGISVFLPICGILTIVGIAATSFGCMLAGISNGVERAYIIAQPLDLLTNSLGGIFGATNGHSLHVDWLKFMSTFFYSFECTSILYWSSVKDFDCPVGSSGCPTSESVLARTGFSVDHLSRNVILLFVYITICHSVGFVGMWMRFKNQTVY